MRYVRRPQQALSALGFKAADYDADVLRVWPENWPILQLLDAMADRWDVLVAGNRVLYHRLDYAALPVIAQAHGIPLTPATLQRLSHAAAAAKAHLNA